MIRSSTNGGGCDDPLTLDDIPGIFSVLSNSLSHDQRQQKEAEGQLQALEIRPNFCSCLVVSIMNLSGSDDVCLVEAQVFSLGLQEIVSHKEADRTARWLASVHLKNMVSKYWRSRVVRCVLWVLDDMIIFFLAVELIILKGLHNPIYIPYVQWHLT